MIRIDTLGGLSVRGDEGKPLAGAAAQPRRMAILALLARAGERGMSREKILALLWPDAGEERGPRALAQALYALRKDLGADEAIGGARELRFDPAIVSTDVAECAAAMARGDDARAVALYQGPFLDGFHLPGADAFTRWVEEERRTLQREHERALESLARAASARGAPADAVGWWRKLAALEPLNARVTVGLMESLDKSGDRAGALRHAHIYQLLVQQELELPPDREVLALAERLRRGESDAAVAIAVAPPPPAPVPYAPPTPPTPATSVEPETTAPPPPPSIARRTARWPTRWVAGLTLAAAGVALLVARATSLPGVRAAPADAASVVAIGHIAAFGSDTMQASMAAAVADLLTTSLARAPGIRVVSHGRMLELVRRAGALADTSADRFVDAARQAGATEVIDGTLYARTGGRLRLDLRRVDLATGAIGDVHTIEGSDLFALVDSGTTRLVAALGTEAPAGSVADVTTRSVAAYRLYERGIHAFYSGDLRAAHGLFDDALAEDSLFALASYYFAISTPDAGTDVGRDSVVARLARTKRLSARAAERDRLTILADLAYRTSSPALRAYAESLATRYPAEVDGHLYAGIALALEGDFAAAVPRLERVVAMDSLGLHDPHARCAACDALSWLASTYTLADSLPAAERVTRRWVRLQPQSTAAAVSLVGVLDSEGRFDEAASIYRERVASEQRVDNVLGFWVMHYLLKGDYPTADRLLAVQTPFLDEARQLEAYWWLAVSRRQQGRIAEALDAARRLRSIRHAGVAGLQSDAVLEAQMRLEHGEPRVAAALFDSLARLRFVGEEPPTRARRMAWGLTHVGSALAAAGDTAALARLVDSVRTLGAASGYGRDHRLHHHLRGLLLVARGDTAGAIDELRQAFYSTTIGYTRTNLILGALYLGKRRPRDAVAILQPALRGSLEASNLYVNRTELHELLARAWDAAAARDSAAAHYLVVVRAWAAPDPVLAPRAAYARARLAVLTPGRAP
ncbi:transcriptional activator domain-containing protein [Gemmatirosa kalamazoonensis]|uniref:Transcriptional activator domain-containing protein n=1 Tax=Gemmatirosa kalamazoonensis TaxID=861299 RepID=W0RQM5_9BACT|nr:BTAD domain-containing putative transcriptional regulator [Gemmatirosa kalamazoonensis]AHG91848.1 transcriptional activator domain-containing protein [Gemmatirosa kalamazoonensis]